MGRVAGITGGALLRQGLHCAPDGTRLSEGVASLYSRTHIHGPIIRALTVGWNHDINTM
jgi:hypothetical protein